MMSNTLTRLDQEALDEIIERADQIGVDLELSLEPDCIWLGQITRRRNEGSPGSGRRVVDMLCELADEADIPIRLVVISWLDAVIEIYEDAGFEHRLGECQAEDDFILMERLPE